ncbi:MAG: hypothetical protein QN131_02415 [Armatimonadota bacterium]|nr:hypothetical protein [Armatimonadota bacterium]
MKREARLLRDKALDSLVLAIEHFNRPYDRGRASTVLILLDHSFEMVLKAAILHRGGRIRERRAKQTLGFDACVRKALSDAAVRFLTEEQALALQTINGLRDAAQHHLLEVPEQQLYLYAQVGVTLFRDILKVVFGQELRDYLPDRVLPVSTEPPKDLTLLVRDEVETVRNLLKPGTRRKVQARARIRALAILEAATRGERTQPTDGELNKVLGRLGRGEKWTSVFPGVASLALSVNGEGIPVQIRITKKEGVPIHLVPEGTPGASVVAVRRVNELDYYTLGLKQLAGHIGLSMPRTLAVVRHLRLQQDKEYFKEIQVGSQRFKRYSSKALERVKKELPALNLDDIWARYGPRRRQTH